MNQLYAIKRETHQTWTQAGVRIPVTVLRANSNVVISKTDVDQYIGFGNKKLKNVNKPEAGNLKKAGISFGVRMIRKIHGDVTDKNVGETIAPSSIFKPGDVVKVTGVSKGMGFAGGMKRHGFHGGPKTHGQSDRARAPGASASGTTPGRLFKGKRMAGRGGNKTVTILHLLVVSVNDDSGEILVKGMVPGAINSTVKVTKTGEEKFDGLFVKKAEEKTEESKKESEPEKKEEPKEPKIEPKEAKPSKTEPTEVEKK